MPTLRLPALKVLQGARSIYCFAVDGKQLSKFTAVSRIHRDHEQLLGYQRPEVAAHVRSIRRYLESEAPLLPNALVIACDSRIRFEPTAPSAHARPDAGYSVPGELLIPVDATCSESDKPAWLVDGQQRAAAIREADIDAFPVAVVAFIADDENDQRTQFVLVNNTRPLPKGLIHELLPVMDGPLPPLYARKQLPATVLARLNTTVGGPFCGAVASPTAPDGYIRDNSVLKMIENSLYEGALYQYRDPADGSGDLDAIVAHLNAYWGLVRDLWPDAWAMPPRASRLTHGVGIQAMGFAMDHLTESVPATHVVGRAAGALTHLRDMAAWTSGAWHLGDGQERAWRDLQNTPNDVRLLTRLLLQAIDERPLLTPGGHP